MDNKLHIAIFLERFPKLSETFVLNQIAYLVKSGHHVDIFPVGRTEEKEKHEEIYHLRLLRRTHYPPKVPKNRTIARIKFTFLMMKRTGCLQLIKLLQSQDFYKSQDLLHRYYLISLVYPFLPYREYDVIHCHFGPTGLRAVFVKSLGLLQGKMITTFYGYDVTVKSMGQAFYMNLFQNCDKFIAISRYIADKAKSAGFEEKKIEVLPIGVNIDEFKPGIKKMGDAVRLLTVARLVEKKGLYFSICAFHKIAEEFPTMVYDIVGEGELMANLKELVSKIGLDHRVIFHGARDKTSVREFYRQADIFVLPSITGSDGNSEGQGLVLQEAQAMALPVVSTFHNGIPEGVLDGITALLVPEKDIEALADKIAYLAQNPEKRIKMGEEGRKFVSTRFNNQDLGERLESIYRRVLET